MTGRPYVVLKCAMSLDGYIDDIADERLLLSNEEDFDRVDELRAHCDAILVGANTIRRDNPRLLVNSDERRQARAARGEPPYPAKVTVTATTFDPALKFFNTGGEKIVYCPEDVAPKIQADMGELATVVGLRDASDFGELLADIYERGIKRLLVEGGSTIHTQFLTQDLADEIQVAIAPFFVGQAAAPRFVNPGNFPQDFRHRMAVKEVRQVGDILFARYVTHGEAPLP
jgi:5-amino-6-(5-phosphoribosylamino)uracil reductase